VNTEPIHYSVHFLNKSFKSQPRDAADYEGCKMDQMNGTIFGGHKYGGHIFGDRHWIFCTPNATE
jgi:hypothetical protein